MKNSEKVDRCPSCGGRLKNWRELAGDERMVVERLPASAEHPIEQRKKHRFCTRCWFEDYGRDVRNA